jgi:hypothetical protein
LYGKLDWLRNIISAFGMLSKDLKKFGVKLK